MTSVHAGELFRFVHRDIDEKISPYPFGYLRRFLMAGIAFENDVGGTGMFEELRAMKFLQRCQVGQPWTNRLTSTGKARHEVGFDLAGENLDVSIEITRINIDVGTTRCTRHKT